MTGFRSYSEFVAETSHYERLLLIESIEAWHREQSSDGGAGGGGGGGLPPGAGGMGL